jgi:polyhydroxybutyrate depolymerase
MPGMAVRPAGVASLNDGSSRGGLAVLIAAMAAATAGCRHPVAPGATPILVDAGDGTAPPHTDSVSFTAGGVTRHLLVHLPGGSASTPRALVLNLHGSGGNAAQQEASIGMDPIADANQFIVAYPDAAIALGGGFAWNVPGQPLLGGGAVPAGAADDVAFFAQAITFLEQRYAIDAHRIFVTGMSGGARMTSQLGCDLGDTVAAIAPVAGLRFPAPCAGTRAVPVVAFHGTADATNPYDGNGEAYWTYSVPVAQQQWGAHDGCAATPTSSSAATAVMLTTYGDCTGGATVALYTIDGAGHEWPGAPGQTPAIDASTTMWSFFSSHPLP